MTDAGVPDALLIDALRLAIDAHAGAKDKAGRPYILHPLSVMAAVSSLDEKVVAILHDAIEDSSLSLPALAARGFPSPILDALASITRRHDEPYDAYIARVGKNDIARTVKIADLKHNLDLSRLTSASAIDLSRLQKYVSSLLQLSRAPTWRAAADDFEEKE